MCFLWLTSVALLVLLSRTTRAGIVAAWLGRLIPHCRVLQLITRHKPPVSIFTFKQALFAMAMLLTILRKPSLKRHECLVFIDTLYFEDLQSMPRRCF